MSATGSSNPTNSDWADTLIEWWSPPSDFDSDDFAAWTKRLQSFALDVQKLMYGACCAQAEAMWTVNERLGRTLQASATSRRRHEVLAGQVETLSHLLEAFATQAKVWAELTQNLHKCCCALGDEAVNECRAQAKAKTVSGSPQSAVVKEAGKVAA